MPYMMLVCLTALMGGITNSHSKFAIFAALPILVNVITISSLIISKINAVSNLSSAIFLSHALVVAGVMQLLLIMIYSHSHKFGIDLKNIFTVNKNVSTFFKNILPAIISSSVVQLNLFISQSIASFIPGAISILAYADRIYQFPLSMIGICFGTVLLPAFSSAYKRGDIDAANDLQNKATAFGLMLSIPCAVGIIALAHPITFILYQHGAFTPEDTLQVSYSISAFALGLPAFVLGKIMMPVFYAKIDTKTPMKITIYTILCNIILNVILMFWIGHIGIALGSSVAAWFNVFLCILHMDKGKIDGVDKSFGTFVKVVCASIVMYVGIYLLKNALYHMIYDYGIMISVLVIAMICFISIVIYFVICVLLHVPLMKYINAYIRKR
jgi:putative peptidoglycan lipid II flippase